MTTTDQIPEIDAQVRSIDLKINKKQLTIDYLEEEQRELARKIDRHKADLRELGRQRAEIATFKLEL